MTYKKEKKSHRLVSINKIKNLNIFPKKKTHLENYPFHLINEKKNDLKYGQTGCKRSGHRQSKT